MGKRAVLYARACADPSHGTSTQIEACRDLSHQRGYDIAEQLVDEASTTPESRPAFETVRALVASGSVDVVVCYTFERLVRSPGDLRLVREEFPIGHATVECVHWDRRVE